MGLTVQALDGAEAAVRGPVAVFDPILAQGSRGLTINRFKSLGEMNPDQLGKATLAPEVRVLLHVRVEDKGGRRNGVLHLDGRRGGAAARLHRHQRAQGGEPEHVKNCVVRHIT